LTLTLRRYRRFVRSPFRVVRPSGVSFDFCASRRPTCIDWSSHSSWLLYFSNVPMHACLASAIAAHLHAHATTACSQGGNIRNTPYSVIPCGFGLALGSFILPFRDHASGGSPAHPNVVTGQRKRVSQDLTVAKALGRGCRSGAFSRLGDAVCEVSHAAHLIVAFPRPLACPLRQHKIIINPSCQSP
jgi:hypothetical protein